MLSFSRDWTRTAVALLVVMALAAGGRAADTQPSASGRTDALGDPLPAGVTRRFGSARLSEGLPIDSLDFSKDGKRLLSGAGSKVHLWSLPEGRLLWELPALERRPMAKFSPDGLTVGVLGEGKPNRDGSPAGGWGSGSSAGTLKIYDAATARELRTIAAENVSAFAFSAKGDLIAAGMLDGSIVLYQAATGEKVRQLKDKKNDGFVMSWVVDVAFSPDGATLASAHQWRSLRVWDVQSGDVRLATPELQGGCLAVSFADEGKLLTLHDPSDVHGTTSLRSKATRQWQVTPGKPAEPSNIEPRRHDGAARVTPTGAFSRDGKFMLLNLRPYTQTGETDRVANCSLGLFDLSAEDPRTLLGKAHEVRAMAFSDDGQLAATGGVDGAIRFWKTKTGERVEMGAPGHEAFGALYSVAVSADGKLLATGSTEGVIRTLEIATGKPVAKLRGHENTVVGLAWSPDSAALASSSHDRTIRLWNVAKSEVAEKFAVAHYSQMNRSTMAFSLDGKFFACSDSNGFYVWDTLARRARSEDAGPAALEFASGLRFYGTPDWRRAMQGRFGVGMLTGSESIPDPGTRLGDYACVAVSPNGQFVVAAEGDRLVLLDGKSRKVLQKLAPRGDFDAQRPVKWIRHVAFSPDGTKIAIVQDARAWGGWRGRTGDPNQVGQEGQNIRIFDVATGAEELKLGGEGKPGEGHRGAIMALAFADRGKSLLTASLDGTVLQWDLTSRPAPVALPTALPELLKLVVSDDQDIAADAMHSLAAKPDLAVEAARAFLSTAPEDADIAALIGALSDSSLEARAKAIVQLAARQAEKPLVESHLRRLLLATGTDAAVARRARDLLEGLADVRTTELRNVERIVTLLEWTGTPLAQAELQRISVLPSNRGGGAAQASLRKLAGGKPKNPTSAPASPTTAAARVVVPVAPPATRAVAPILAAAPGIGAALDPADQTDPAPLPSGAVARFGSSSFRHGEAITTMSFSADFRRVATAGDDGYVRVWDIASGRQLCAAACAVEFPAATLSPDGKRVFFISPRPPRAQNKEHREGLAARDVDGGKAIWTLENGERESSKFTTIAASPDGRFVAVGTGGGKICLYDPATGTRGDVLDAGRGSIGSIQWSPDSRWIVVGSTPSERSLDAVRSLQVWNVSEKKNVHTIEGSTKGQTPAILIARFTADSRLLVYHPGQTITWPDKDVPPLIDANKTAEQEFLGLLLDVSPDGKELLMLDGRNAKSSLGYDRVATYRPTLHSVDSGETLARYGPVEQTEPVSGFAPRGMRARFSPDGKTIAIAGGGGRIQFFEVRSGKPLPPFAQAAVMAMSVSDDGKTMAIGYADGSVTLRQLPKGNILKRFQASELPLTAVALSRDGAGLATAAHDATVRLWETASGRMTGDSTSTGTDMRAALIIKSLGWSDDSRYVGGGGYEGGRLWNAPAATVKQVLGSGRLDDRQYTIRSVRFVDKPFAAVVLQTEQRTSYRELESETASWSLEYTGGFALSRDGRMSASFFRSTLDTLSPSIVDVRTGTLLARLEAKGDGPHRPKVEAATFGAEDSRLAVVEDAMGNRIFRWDQTLTEPGCSLIHIWDMGTSSHLVTYRGHEGPVCAAVFGEGNKVLYTGSADGTVLGWKVPEGVAGKRFTDFPDILKAIRPVSGETLGSRRPTTQPVDVSWQAVLALASEPEKGLAAIDRYYVLAAEEDAEVVTLIKKLGSDDAEGVKAAKKKLEELQSSFSRSGRGMLRVLLDPKTPDGMAREAAESFGRMSASEDVVVFYRVLYAVERMKRPAAVEHMKLWAQRLPARHGGEFARRAAGLPQAVKR